MLATGGERLERMRDGRVVYVGAEPVDDVTTHPAFRNGAHTIAALYDLADPQLKDRFERWWGTASMPATARYKLYKPVWDLIGSEFAGRHMLYEKFYAGNSTIVPNQSDREAPWDKFHGIVDGLRGAVPIPAA